jgi:ribonuclease E
VAAKGPAPADEFASDLFAEQPPSPARGESARDDADEPQRHRRRRRRRGRPDEAGAVSEGTAEAVTDDEDDRVSAESTEEGEGGPVAEGTTETDEDRPRRRRRRRRRRPGDRTEEPRVREASVDRDEESVEGEEPDEGEASEPVARIRYDDVPTWEEAISYLIRTRGEPPRGRGDDRDRRGPRRPPRRPSSEDRSRGDA